MDSHHRQLLIVEDHPETRRSLGAIFSRRGWDVRSATTVAEAVDLLESGLEPDCLILDLRLPDGAGEVVLGKVQNARLRTRIIVCTGDSDVLRTIQVRAFRPDLVLFKPVDATVICNLCDNLARIGLTTVPDAQEARMDGPRTLVLVEDDARTRLLLRQIFAADGWDVAEASTVADAFPLLDPPPDSLILDLSFPEGDGLDLLRWVRSEKLPTRVAVTTGVADPSRIEAVKQLEPDALLFKPVDVDALRDAFE